MAHFRSESLESTVEPIVPGRPPSMIPRPSNSSSLLYTMLPGAVKHRLSTMPSLRNSITSYSLRPSKRSRAPLDTRPRSADCSSLQIYSGGVRPPGPDPTDFEPGFKSNEVGTGTGWKYANQGQDVMRIDNGHLADANRHEPSGLSCH